MYSKYTALFTHSTQRTCTVACIIYTLYNVHIDSELYLVLYFIIYRMYVKTNVLYVHCTAYISHILYIRALRNKPFIFLVIVYLPSKDQRVKRCKIFLLLVKFIISKIISKITTRHTRNVCKCEYR